MHSLQVVSACGCITYRASGAAIPRRMCGPWADVVQACSRGAIIALGRKLSLKHKGHALHWDPGIGCQALCPGGSLGRQLLSVERRIVGQGAYLPAPWCDYEAGGSSESLHESDRELDCEFDCEFDRKVIRDLDGEFNCDLDCEADHTQ